MRNVIYLICLILSLSLFSCWGQDYNKYFSQEPYEFSPIYQKDSIFMAFTVLKFIENKYLNFDSEGLDEKYVEIDSILYSVDSLKCFVFVICKEHNHNDPRYLLPNQSVKEFNYVGEALIGYRRKKSRLWDICPVRAEVHANSPIKRTIEVILRVLYFERLKNDEIRPSVKYDYNLNEEGFWNGVFWQKNKEGEYKFRELLRCNDKIEYPDEIKNMFDIN
jgi:hypothetical protein